jgi:hypothetical protein
MEKCAREAHQPPAWSGGMSEHPVFAPVDPALLPVLEELRPLEPIFHTREFGTTLADFDRRMAADYFEVGASGRRYSRDFILATLAENAPEDAAAAGWECTEFGLRPLSDDTYLLTYTLRQWERLTRRATLWRRTGDGWQIVYHQGTLAGGHADDTQPSDGEKAHPPQEFEHARVRPAHVRVRGVG